jgi:hypothetical protein
MADAGSRIRRLALVSLALATLGVFTWFERAAA